jgi:HD-like signal output (HDOD) protein
VQKPISLDELDLPKASTRAARILQIMGEDEPNLDEIDNLIAQDPILAVNIIRYANSPMHRRAQEVGNVPTATRLLGLKNVRSAVVMSTLKSSLPSGSSAIRAIFDHLVAIAAFCKAIARECCRDKADDMELVGLVHDVGQLVLASNYEAEYKQLMQRADAENKPLDILEKEIFGIFHDQLAVRICHAFRLPAAYRDVIEGFHNERFSENGINHDQWQREHCILALAHHLLRNNRLNGTNMHETLNVSAEFAQEMLGLDDQRVQGIVDEACLTIAPSR